MHRELRYKQVKTLLLFQIFCGLFNLNLHRIVIFIGVRLLETEKPHKKITQNRKKNLIKPKNEYTTIKTEKTYMQDLFTSSLSLAISEPSNTSFKILLISYEVIHGMAPDYISK